MKSYFFLLLFTAVGCIANAQKESTTPYMTKSFSGESIKSAEVETSGGNIWVTGGTESRVEVLIKKSNNRNGDRDLSKEEIQSRLDADYTLDVSVSNGKVIAKAKPKRNNMDLKKALSISFRLYVPNATATDLTTSGGNIELNNLSGEQKFSTSGGNLRLDALTGKTKGTTSGGNIYVNNCSNDIKLSTSGGNIQAKDSKGDMHLSTSGGSLDLVNLNGVIDASTSGGNVEGERIEGELSAHTSGGNIKLAGLSCSLDASTSGGHIEVAIKDLRKSIKLSNSGGNISLRLPKGSSVDLNLRADKVSTDRLDAFSGTIEDNEVSGKLNGGGTSVRANAGSGKVSLSFQ